MIGYCVGVECILSSVSLAPSLASVLAVGRGVAGPEGEVVPEELHYQSTVLVAVFIQSIQLRYSVVKCLELLFEISRLIRMKSNLSLLSLLTYLLIYPIT